MSQFNTSIKKLQTIWNRIVENNNEIKNKDNSDTLDFFTNLLKQQNIKVPIQIFDSGDINSISSPISTASTAIKGEKMPSLISYSKNIDINLPEILLPFVKYSIEVSPIPETEVHGVFEYDPSTWSGDNIEVRGDGTLIWKGNPIVDTNLPFTFIIHNEASLVEKGISLDLTKETWDADIDVDPPIGGFDTIAGKVLLVSATEIITENSCLANNDTKIFTIFHFGTKEHKITELTSSGFTGIGDETIRTFTDDGEGGCDENIVVNNNVTRTIEFSSLDNYTFLIDTPSQSIAVSKGSIISQEFEKSGRWLFYSTELQKIFVSKNIGTDGDFAKIELRNLPNTNDGDTLPYTNITLTRNLDGTNDPLIIKKQSEGVFTGILGDTLTSIAKTGREFKNYLKTSLSTSNITTYRFKLQGSFLITSPSIVLNDLIEFPVYNDIYTIVGTTYSLTTEDHTILFQNIWIPDRNQIILNIKAYLVNPLYWREERKYNK